MIRLATPCEIEALGAVEKSAATVFEGTHMSWAVASAHPPQIYQRALEEGLLWVYDVGTVAGFVAASRQKDCIFIEELSVARDYQRRGFGRALLDTATARGAHLGCRAAVLITDRHLPWNKPFYERAGFCVVPHDDVEPWLGRRLSLEAQTGLDPAHRCAMLKIL